MKSIATIAIGLAATLAGCGNGNPGAFGRNIDINLRQPPENPNARWLYDTQYSPINTQPVPQPPPPVTNAGWNSD